jgi:hypothetical protein
MGRLRRFLPPQVADLIVASGTKAQPESHRREITALFCDLAALPASPGAKDKSTRCPFDSARAYLSRWRELMRRSALAAARASEAENQRD